MASKSDIEAGKAYVSLYVKNSALVKGLRSASKQLQSFGAGIAKIGGIMSAAGGAILAPMVGLVKQFSDVGDAVDKMAGRTGLSAEAVSELGHAAGLSGTDIGTLENGLRRMQKTVADAADGTETAVDALAKLGLSAADLRGLSPDQQMELLAEAISKIEDPGMRAAAAMEVFGKSGTQLLPMFADGAAGIAAMRQEARDLGLVLTGEDAKAAAALNDNLGRMWSTIKAVGLQIGAALAPAATMLAGVITNVVSKVVEFVRNNRQMVVTIAAVAAGLTIAGTAIVGLGGAITLLGMALGGIATGIAAVGAVIGAILSPIGLVVTGLAAAGVAFFKFTSAGQQLAAWIGEQFRGLLDEVRGVIGGISDALAAGDMTLAAHIAWAGVQLAFYTARDAIFAGFEDLKSAGMVAWTSIKLAFVQTTNFISSVWDTFATGLTSVFDGVIVNIRQAWNSVTSWIAQQLLKLWGVIEPVLNSLGLISEQTDIGGAIKIVQEDNKRFSEGLDRDKAKRDERRGADMAARDKERADALAAAEKERQAALDAFASGGTSGESPEVASARADLDRLKKEAADAAAAAGATGGTVGPEIEVPNITAAGKGGAATTFSAAALQALGQGAGPMEKLVKVGEDQKKIAQKQLEVANVMSGALLNLGTLLTLTP